MLDGCGKLYLCEKTRGQMFDIILLYNDKRKRHVPDINMHVQGTDQLTSLEGLSIWPWSWDINISFNGAL